MKLSISNIAWPGEQDEAVYELMKQYGFIGLEIAPTRWFAQNPYEHIQEARKEYEYLNQKYGLQISSMQSIWYGKSENIWNNEEDREKLERYTKEAVDFAEAIGCRNLVFGCPRNRNMPEGVRKSEVFSFFRNLGSYAEAHNTVVAMEANPPIYHTNYINRTDEAIALIKKIDSSGFRLNLDIGTMIENGEDIEVLKENWTLVNHVHVSEPFLAPIQKRLLHRELAHEMRQNGYSGFVSVEMGSQSNMEQIKEAMAYVAEVFG